MNEEMEGVRRWLDTLESAIYRGEGVPAAEALRHIAVTRQALRGWEADRKALRRLENFWKPSQN